MARETRQPASSAQRGWRSALRCAAALVTALALTAPAAASDDDLSQADEIKELRRQLDVVVDEVQRLRTELAVPEQGAVLEGKYGLGPAASKVYDSAGRVSLGGYAEAVYRNRFDASGSADDDVADFVRAVLYVGYKFNDWLVFNSEFEWEHASTSKNGEVSVEMATLDFLLWPEMNARAGLMLIPMGYLNEVHEPPFYLGTQRPEPERRIIPSTWRENGVGIFGTLWERFDYRAYVVNGLDGSGFDSSGLRGGRQKGSEAKAEDVAFVARGDFDLFPGARVGGSYYVGDSGQDQTIAGNRKLPDARTSIWEVHGQYRTGPLFLRSLYTAARVSDAGSLSTELGLPSDKPVASSMFGLYTEASLEIMQWLFAGSEKSLQPFFRYEYLDTQETIPSRFSRDRSQPKRLFIPGIQFKPHPSVVLKLDYRKVENWTDTSADEVSLGFGLVF